MRLLVAACATTMIGLLGCGSEDAAGPTQIRDADLPQSPQNLEVEKIGDGEVWLLWQGAASGTQYVIYRSEDEGVAVAVDSTFDTSYRDLALSYEVEYSYFVVAVLGEGEEGTPTNLVSGQPFNNLSPQAPAALRATAHNISILGRLEIVLDWRQNAESDLSFYRVYRALQPDFSPGPATLLGVVSEPRLVDEEVAVGTPYYYRVTAVDRGGKESASSVLASDVALAEPRLDNPIGGTLAPAVPVFRWRAVGDASFYRVIVTSSPTSGELSDMPLSRDTTTVFLGRSLASGEKMQLESGTVYYWKVVASTKENGVENSVSAIESFKIR